MRRVITASHWGSYYALVDKDRVVGVEPFERDPAPSSMIEAMPEALYAPSRVVAPMVRKSWLDHGPGARPERRGADPFVRISWDEASRLVAGEIDRVRTETGNEAIFGGSYGWSSAGRLHHAKSQVSRFLNLAGGYTASVGNYSMGAGMVIIPHILGKEHPARGPAVDWDILVKHTELFVCFGGMPIKNAQIESGGLGAHYSAAQVDKAKARGAAYVLISPVESDLPAHLEAEQISIIPNTDTAMILGLCHALIEADLHDRAYLNRYCEGFETFRAYVTGESDGLPKSANWAASVTGVPADTIRALAYRMAAVRTFVSLSLSVQRCHHGEQTYWAGTTLAAMLGQIGVPGGGVGFGYMAVHGMGHAVADATLPTFSQGRNPIRTFIPVARISEMLERPGDTIDYNGQRVAFPDIRLIYWAGGNPFHHHQDLNRLRAALHGVDTIIVHEPWWTPFAKHADIVLPASTTLERNDIMAARADRFLVAMKQAVPPVGEALSDFDILARISDHLGLREAFTDGRDEMGWLRHMYDTARARNADAGIALPDFDAFWEQGSFEFPAPNKPWDPFEAFYADPVANPLRTPSGRIEIGSETIAGFGYDDCPGHAAWMEPAEWLGAPRAEQYPLHLLSNQPAKRLHSQLAMTRIGGERREHDREAIRISPIDAAPRRIRTGDLVRVWNDRGAFLATAHVTDDMRERVALISTGTWFDPMHPGTDKPLDKNGNANSVTLDIGTSKLAQATSAQTTLVDIERWNGDVPEITAYHPPEILAADHDPRPPAA